ncbi:hypothetical protein BDK51DRAFT_26514, partial [Blyttiomyces helicus]
MPTRFSSNIWSCMSVLEMHKVGSENDSPLCAPHLYQLIVLFSIPSLTASSGCECAGGEDAGGVAGVFGAGDKEAGAASGSCDATSLAVKATWLVVFIPRVKRTTGTGGSGLAVGSAWHGRVGRQNLEPVIVEVLFRRINLKRLPALVFLASSGGLVFNRGRVHLVRGVANPADSSKPFHIFKERWAGYFILVIGGPGSVIGHCPSSVCQEARAPEDRFLHPPDQVGQGPCGGFWRSFAELVGEGNPCLSCEAEMSRISRSAGRFSNQDAPFPRSRTLAASGGSGEGDPNAPIPRCHTFAASGVFLDPDPDTRIPCRRTLTSRGVSLDPDPDAPIPRRRTLAASGVSHNPDLDAPIPRRRTLTAIGVSLYPDADAPIPRRRTLAASVVSLDLDPDAPIPRGAAVTDPTRRFPYTYPGCSYVARWKQHLTSHVGIHLPNNKPFKCEPTAEDSAGKNTSQPTLDYMTRALRP